MNELEQSRLELIDKFLHGSANEDEIKELNTWYHSFDDAEVELSDMSYEDMKNQKKKILSRISKSRTDLKSKQSVIIPFVWKFAASLAVFLMISVYLMNEKTATKITTIEQITETSEFGQKRTFTLKDGSVVKLNAGSSLTFPTTFDSNSRVVELKGEAFFQVAPEANRPFKVITGDIVTVALGTSFNINTHQGKGDIDISLATGKVVIEPAHKSNGSITPLFLAPGEMASYNSSTTNIQKFSFSAEEILAWKKGIIYFKNADEIALIEKLERWYDIEIEIENKTKKPVDISTQFENASLENVLKSLGYTLGFDYSIDDKKVKINYINKAEQRI